jgi:hypothetical protein
MRSQAYWSPYPLVGADPQLVLLQDREHDEMFGWLRELLRSYRETLVHDRRVLLEQFHLADFARKVVGVGSVGSCVLRPLTPRDSRQL